MAQKKLDTLTEQMYYVLLALTEERHGYGIMQDTAALTGGRVIIGAGTLYALLSRFEADGLRRAGQPEILPPDRGGPQGPGGRAAPPPAPGRGRGARAAGRRGRMSATWRRVCSGRPAQARRVGRASPGMSPAPAVLLIRPGMGGVVK